MLPGSSRWMLKFSICTWAGWALVAPMNAVELPLATVGSIVGLELNPDGNPLSQLNAPVKPSIEDTANRGTKPCRLPNSPLNWLTGAANSP